MTRKTLIVAAAAVALALAPWAVPQYLLAELTMILVYSILVMGLVILTGRTGQLSIGHSAFFGLGAYTTGVSLNQQALPVPAAVLAGTLLAVAVAVVFGVPALRLRGFNLAVITAGLAIVFPILVQRAPDLTGGPEGLAIRQPEAPFGLALSPASWVYLMVLVCAAGALIAAAWVVRGRMGRALDTIRLSEITAESVGINVSRHKQAAFAISAAFAGFAGGLYALALGFIAPSSFGLMVNLTFIAALVVGGSLSLWGALVGAVFIQVVPDLVGAANPAYTELFYASALIVVVLAAPLGVVGSIGRFIESRRDSRRKENETTTVPLSQQHLIER